MNFQLYMKVFYFHFCYLIRIVEVMVWPKDFLKNFSNCFEIFM